MKAHQNVIIGGVDVGDNKDRKYSKFCNEGKWDNFIKPLLPQDPKELTLIEYGSNAGLYLKMSKEYGFYRVIGIEHGVNSNHVARKYREDNGLDYRLIGSSINQWFDFRELPLADVTLMANFHYHQPVQEFVHILDQLESKTAYILLVGAVVPEKERHWKISSYLEKAHEYFKNWDLVRCVPPLEPNYDPHPRIMYSFLFKSRKIERVPIEALRLNREFLRKVINKGKFDVRKTKYYRKIERRKRVWHDKTEGVYEEVEAKRKHLYDRVKNGVRNPIIIDSQGLVLDGAHRCLLAQELGHKTIIARRI